MKIEKCIIVHGCPSHEEKVMDEHTRTYDKHWISWLTDELERRGIVAEKPLMPEPWEPVYEKFKDAFERIQVTEQTALVGHSCGSAFLVRWLGESKSRIAKLVLVAPWKIPTKERRFRERFYTYPIDKSIRDRVEEIVMFTADDEEADGKESLNIFHDALGGRVIELSGHGHYTMGDMGTVEFPELLKELT